MQVDFHSLFSYAKQVECTLEFKLCEKLLLNGGCD